MKIQTFGILACLASLTTYSSAALSFSLRFSVGNNALTNIADENGTAATGLSWGILIAESGNDFSAPIAASPLGLSTADGSLFGSGIRFFNGGLTVNLPFGTDTGSGVINTSGNIDASAFEPEIGTGDSFALIWFQNGFTSGTDNLEVGDNYGILTDNNFLVPSDGSTLAPFTLFAGPDPVRSANLVVQAIPEPSSLMLLALGSGFLAFRRRS